MELSKATLELLRDEAYVLLCRDTLQESMKTLEQEKTVLVNSRPPFGVLAAKKTRDAFESSLKTAGVTEAALRTRLDRAARYETWLNRCIRRELATYLEAISAEYQRVAQIKRLLDEWEHCATRQLPDILVAFAREMRGLRLAAAESGRAEPACAHELALLREITVRVEQHQDHLGHVAAAVNVHALEIGLIDVRVPSLPQFRRSAWVDWLCVIPLEQAIADVTRVEAEVRAFIHGGMQPIMGRLQASRVGCVQRQENYLQQYWDQLRAHAQAHWVEERDVDQVLDTLAERYDGDIVRRQREVTHNPFVSER
jgi:hypothetical protein